MEASVSVKFFGAAADLAGTREVELPVKEGTTLGDLWSTIAERYPALSPMRDSLAYAINSEYARWTDTVTPGVEVAVLPPVSGG